MKMEFQRKKCKKEFNRELLTQVNEHPAVIEKIAATIDKVELVGNKFCAVRGEKCCKVLFIILSAILTLSVATALIMRASHRVHKWNQHHENGIREAGPHQGPDSLPQNTPQNGPINGLRDGHPSGHGGHSGHGGNHDKDHNGHGGNHRLLQAATGTATTPTEPATVSNTPANQGESIQGGKPGCKRQWKDMKGKMRGMLRKMQGPMRQEWMNKLGFQVGNPEDEKKMDFIFMSFSKIERHQKKVIFKMSKIIEKINSTTMDWDKTVTPIAFSQTQETFSQNEVSQLLNTQREQDKANFNIILGQQRYQELGLFTIVSAHHRRHGHCHIGPIFFFWLITLIGMCVQKKKASNLRLRIENLLTIENRTIFRELGFFWSIDNSLTILTLTSMNSSTATQQQVSNVYPQSNPFMQQAPMQLQRISNQHVAPIQYVPLNMDETMMSARDIEYR